MSLQQSRDQLLGAYRQMKTIREFEERLHKEIMTGEIAGFTHLILRSRGSSCRGLSALRH